MKILAIDIGTGTQDILLYNSKLDIENAYKLVMPSPTMFVRNKLREATRQGRSVVLTGVMMGGGPSTWGAEEHLRMGLPLFATPNCARTFNDDLDRVKEMGVTLVSEEEAARLPQDVARIELRDFDLHPISNAFQEFGVDIHDISALAIAVFDHGAAPQGISDRQFRFDYLNARIRSQNQLTAFAFLRDQIPEIMTRFQAVAQSAGDISCPLIVMDTAPAAVLGAMFDPIVSRKESILVANVGNFHTLAFRLGKKGIEGVFEHHTGFLDRGRLEKLLLSLADGTLTHQEVFNSNGHGALVYAKDPLEISYSEANIVVTGPRRSMLHGSSLRPYFAVPFGDMMMAGCYGLLAATAHLIPDLSGNIEKSLRGSLDNGIAPWDV